MPIKRAAQYTLAIVVEAKNRAEALGKSIQKTIVPTLLVKTYFLLCLCFIFLLNACAMGGPHMYYLGFEFDFGVDSPGMEVLDYQFGDSGQTLTLMSTELKREGRGTSHISRTLHLPKPEFLYVKWRDIKTRQVYEDRVSFQDILPDDISDYGFYFFVKGPQLYVYLLSPHYDKRPADWPKGPIKYESYRKQWELYPNPTDFSQVKLLHRSDFKR